MNKLLKVIIVGLASAWLASGCVQGHKDMYYWGEYESILQDMYTEPGSAGFDVQIEKLTTDIQRAADDGKPTPPGIYAHLGFVYATQGNSVKAKQSFIKEKKLYPESATFINGLMKRAFKRG